MKFLYITYVAATILASGVSAQSISEIPGCARPCIEEARIKSGCAEGNYKCLCDGLRNLMESVGPCVISVCRRDVASGQVSPAVQKFCMEVAFAASSIAAPFPMTTSITAAPNMTADGITPGTVSAAANNTSTPMSTMAPNGTTSANATISTGQGAGTPTSAAPESTPSGGAAMAGSMGSLGMLVLGALAAF